MGFKSGTGITFIVVLVIFTTLLSIAIVSGHPHHGSSRRQRSHSHHHHFRAPSDAAAAAVTADAADSDTEKTENSDDTILSNGSGRRRQSSGDRHRTNSHRNRNKHAEPLDDNYDDEDGGRHAYLMRSDHSDEEIAGNEPEKLDEDQALTQAFEKHIRPSNKNFKPVHDVYAYQLPSDLWFIVRYAKTPEGQVEKYMNIVDSFTNYLDKLEHGVKTVSVNVKGVETVFRLTSRPRH